MAVIRGLSALKEPCRVTLTTDSSYVRDGITKWIHGWKLKNWKTKSRKDVKNRDLWEEIDNLSGRHEIEWKWVRGHAGHRENEICDELARQESEKYQE